MGMQYSGLWAVRNQVRDLGYLGLGSFSPGPAGFGDQGLEGKRLKGGGLRFRVS